MNNVAVVFSSLNNGPVALWLAREVHYILGDRLSWLSSTLVRPFARAAERVACEAVFPSMRTTEDWDTLVGPMTRMAHTGQNTYNHLAASGGIPADETNLVGIAIDAFDVYRLENGMRGQRMAMLLTNYDEKLDNGCLDAYFHRLVIRVSVAEDPTDTGIRRRLADIDLVLLPDHLARVKTLKLTGAVVDQHLIMQLADIIAMDALRWIHSACAKIAPRPVGITSLSDEGVRVSGDL